MALTTAERQQRYRKCHLGVKGTKERLQLFIGISAEAKLKRLALHYGYTVTKMVEVLAAEAEEALLDSLTPHQQQSICIEAECRDACACAGGWRRASLHPCDTLACSMPWLSLRAPFSSLSRLALMPVSALLFRQPGRSAT